MRAIVSLIIFLIAMWLIFYMLGIFKVVEELVVFIAFFVASGVMLVPTFLWHLITNQPRRSTKFKISTNPTTHDNIGGGNGGLPPLPDEHTWWRATIYLESEIPTKVKALRLLLKGKREDAHDFKEVELQGAQDIHWQYYYFSIPADTKFGKQKAEIIAVTEQDDYGSGKIILRD